VSVMIVRPETADDRLTQLWYSNEAVFNTLISSLSSSSSSSLLLVSPWWWAAAEAAERVGGVCMRVGGGE